MNESDSDTQSDFEVSFKSAKDNYEKEAAAVQKQMLRQKQSRIINRPPLVKPTSVSETELIPASPLKLVVKSKKFKPVVAKKAALTSGILNFRNSRALRTISERERSTIKKPKQ